MKTWKRNAVIAGVLVVVCAGIYLNWLYGGSTPELTETLDAGCPQRAWCRRSQTSQNRRRWKR